jgi:glycosyltransferase involved in cell wall biosynthesis
VLLDVLECILSLPERQIEPAVFGFVAPDAETSERCQQLGIPLEIISSDEKRQRPCDLETLVALRGHLQKHRFAAAVWVSVPPGASTALAMRIAPAQIFFAMKYHSLALPEIDGYMTGGSVGQRFRTIEGRQWRAGQTRFGDLYDPNLAALAAETRAQYGTDRLVMGCIGRDDKINSPAFLDAVCTLLKKYPRTVFLWTGYTRLPAIQKHFENAGVADRCHYIGWVNTKLYAQVLDIFLDSFPFPCGLTALQAMAAGTPIVFYNSEEVLNIGIPLLINPVFNGEAGSEEEKRRIAEVFHARSPRPLYLMANTPAEYVEMASRLIEDVDHRQAVGNAVRTFTEEFLSASEPCGRTYQRHIVEVIEDKAAAAKG